MELDTRSPTLKAMEKHWTQSEWVRNLGASSIGGSCERQIWMQWRYVLSPDFPPRILRLFQRGHNEEATFIAELKAAGVKVFGCQETIMGYKGHFTAHPDGKAVGIIEAPKTEHLLEFKTASDKKFQEMQSKGVEKAQPKHYAQMQIQMYLTGITRAFYLVVNKNTDELYAERIKADNLTGERLQARIERIVDTTEPPAKAESFECRWCEFRTMCLRDRYDDAELIPNLSCRTCCFSTPIEGGEWQCEKYKRPIPKEFQLKGCSKHLLIPGIIDAEVMDTDGQTYVKYENGLLNFNDEFSSSVDTITEDTLTHGVPF